MKRKRSVSNSKNKYICRHHLCTILHDSIEDIFCEKHRTNTKKSARELFFSLGHDIPVPDDIIIYILLMNIPYRNLLDQDYNFEGEISLDDDNNILSSLYYDQTLIRTPKKREWTKLGSKDVRQIFSYFTKISSLSKSLKKTIDESIEPYYRLLYMFDNDNQSIKYREYDGRSSYIKTSTMFTKITTTKLPKHYFLTESDIESIKEFYKDKYIGKYYSQRSKKKKTMIISQYFS